MAHVKICGVTTTADALACAELGASAIGLNFVPSSPRCITVGRARDIARAVRSTKVLVVGVVANLSVDEMRALVHDVELGCVQLHGDESPEVLTPLLPHAYKAVRIATDADVSHARRFAGDYLLADAKVAGALGGTGETFDWALVKELARERKLTLAGGLRPENVASAVREVAPWCVDVASGVEDAPGVKNLDAVRAFIAAAGAPQHR
ncbi:MAG TPA: phosphoribosylanthranilate isomerase [Labilithrix sp.]|jgi:phosphoribosylanthranilate isomerase|nr:phosphoribosylanthranilate isomerase [Labilithrix sp.]